MASILPINPIDSSALMSGGTNSSPNDILGESGEQYQDEHFVMDHLNRFVNSKALENQFDRDYSAKYRSSLLRAVTVCLMIWTALYALDLAKWTSGHRRNIALTLAVRSFDLLLGAGFILASYKLHLRDFVHTGTAIMFLVFGISQVIFGVIENDCLDPTYSISLSFFASIASTVFRLRFLSSVAVNSGLLLSYCILTAAFGAYNSLWDFLVILVILCCCNMLFGTQAFAIEYQSRTAFVNLVKLQQSEVKSNSLLRRMLPLVIINELKQGAEFIAESFPSVTVLFCKIYNFDEG